MPSTLNKDKRLERPAYWSGVFAMALCVFALIASEFMPVSLLTTIAQDLHITEGLAGQGITVSGVFAVITSLTISYLAKGVDRKHLLLVLTAIMAISGLIVSLAQNYTMYMIGRAFIGMVIGGFWSLSVAIAMRLVPESDVPRALAIFNGGNALAMVVAAPLGSYLGAIIGWRGAFFCLVPIAVLTWVWQFFSLPSMPQKISQKASRQPSIISLFRSSIVTVGMLSVSLFFMGQFTLYTYVRPFLETVTKVDVSKLSLILLGIGVMGLIGTSVVNLFLKRKFYTTLIMIPMIMATIALALIFFGMQQVAVTILLGLWGFLATASPVGWWSWLARTLPDDAELGGGLMVAVIQLAIALGSTIGGILFDYSGYQLVFAVSAIILTISSILTVFLAKK